MKKIIESSAVQKNVDADIFSNELQKAISGDGKTQPLLNMLLNYSFPEKVVILLCLIPNYSPSFFDDVIKQLLPAGGDFPEFGGIRGSNHRGMLPTGETAQFILAGDDVKKRILVHEMLTNGQLVKENILWLEEVKEGEPVMSGRLVLSQEWLSKFITGKELPPVFSTAFPAKKITTQMQWEDLVLNHATLNQINDLLLWMQHHTVVLKDPVLKRKLKPGYRVLFHGPSGTGKTLTATLIGKQFNKDVYRIDLSQVVSKYIGETEKNLEKIFAKAGHKDWILFFDEADALFGKRTNVQNSHDRYANQEVSYLLQRVEDFPGLIILASNFKSNIDSAFLRRFNSIIYFPMPTVSERLRLWQSTLPASHQPEPAVDLQELSEKYDLTGAAILNVVHDAMLHTISKKDMYLRKEDLLEAIRKEFRKEERSMNQ